MNDEQDLTDFERRAQTLLREGANQLDGATRSRLTQARAAAMAQRESRSGWLNLRTLAPVGAVAAGLLIAVLFLGQPGSRQVNPAGGSALDDLDLLADADAYELGQESDLEFVEWAAAEAQQEPVGG
jgi:hypothetical protein